MEAQLEEVSEPLKVAVAPANTAGAQSTDEIICDESLEAGALRARVDEVYEELRVQLL